MRCFSQILNFKRGYRMKKLKKFLALFLCAAISTPFTGTYAISRTKMHHVSREKVAKDVCNYVGRGKVFSSVSSKLEPFAEMTCRTYPVLGCMLALRIARYRDLLSRTHLSKNDKNVLKNFFGAFWLRLNFKLNSGIHGESLLEIIKKENIGIDCISDKGVTRRFRRDASELEAFVINTMQDLKGHSDLSVYFLSQCLQMALV